MLGRFIANDPYEGNLTDPLSWNPYIYCADNPLIYIDPDGKWLVGVIGSVVGAIAGSVAVAAGTAKVADAITGTKSSSKIYKDTKAYLTSSEAKKAYMYTVVAVGTGAVGKGSIEGVAYVKQVMEKLRSHPIVRTIEEQIITFSYRHLDKIIAIQETADDLVKPGAPQTLLGKGKAVYNATAPHAKAAANYVKEAVPKKINQVKQTYVQFKTMVEKQLGKAQVFIQQKGEQIKGL